MDVFNFCGKLSLPKESEKFHPIEHREFASSWENMTVKFNCISGTNRVLCMAQGGKWQSDSKNVIKTFSKSTTDENGKTIKGEMIEIPWNKRFDADQIDKVAGFRKFTCDTGDSKMRYGLQGLVAAFENGSVTDGMKTQFGIDNLEDAKAALEKSNAKKKVFLSEWDFAQHLAKVLQSGKYKDKLFYVSGTYDVQYNADKQQFYTNYHVNRVVLAPDDAEQKTELKVDFYFGEDAFDDSNYEENGKATINGWVSYYDNMVKSNGFRPMVVTVKESEKKTAALKRKFSVEEGIKQIGLTLNVVEGAETVELTMDMLDEETREDIECGLLDWETVKRELGGRAIGDRVSELRFAELTPRKNAAQDTVYTADDMRPAVTEQKDKDVVEQKDEDEDFDLFSDSDLDDDL